MHHVASQMRSDAILPEQPGRRATSAPVLQRSPEFHEFQRPQRGRLPRNKSSSDEVPGLSLLVTNNDNRLWDCGSIRHIRNPSSASDIISPSSAIGSVWESPLSATESPYTPASSCPSHFVAELEDTSSAIVSRLRILEDPLVTELESYINKLKRPEFSTRANIVIESITTMESDNRFLLERAIAAEEAALQLKLKNESLQHRIDYCQNLHRPKSVTPEKKRSVSSAAITSTFNMASGSPQLPQTPHTPQIQNTTIPPSRRRPTPTPLKLPKLPPSAHRNNPSLHSSDPFYINYGPRTPPSWTPTTTPSSARRRLEPMSLSDPLLTPTLPLDASAAPFAAIPIQRRCAPSVHHTRSFSDPNSTLNSAPHKYPTINTTTPTPYLSPDYSLNSSPYDTDSVPTSATTSRSFPFTKLCPLSHSEQPSPLPSSSISAPIPGTVNHHPVVYRGITLSSPIVPTISLGEARRRACSMGTETEADRRFRQEELWKEKPLPPNGGMSPSAVRGRVEIGCERREAVEDQREQRRRGFSTLFKWNKRGATI